MPLLSFPFFHASLDLPFTCILLQSQVRGVTIGIKCWREALAVLSCHHAKFYIGCCLEQECHSSEMTQIHIYIYAYICKCNIYIYTYIYIYIIHNYYIHIWVRNCFFPRFLFSKILFCPFSLGTVHGTW